MDLLTTSHLSVHMTPDCTSLVIQLRRRNGETSVPVPTTELVALGVRGDENADARYTIPSGHSPRGRQFWVEFVFEHDQPWQLGPFAAPDATTLVLAYERWRLVRLARTNTR